ncbi:MAG: CRISPR-associated helicase Cas3' [Saprospiraceae bacterium]
MNTISKFFEAISIIHSQELPIGSILRNAELYRAHRHESLPPETLEEHINLVDTYFLKLVEHHALESVIDLLIEGIIEGYCSDRAKKLSGKFLKKAFVNVIHYHDFGKVNENFQADPKKMNNPNFRIIRNHVLKSHHSKLGAYIFSVRHFNDALTELKECPQIDAKRLLLNVLHLSYSIIRHHASNIDSPNSKGISYTDDEIPVMKNYLALYGMAVPSPLAEQVFLSKNLKDKYFYQSENLPELHKLKFDFTLFALLRLNFSLLTAADFMATGHYTHNKGKDFYDFGTIDQILRKRIIDNARSTESYNAEAFQLAEQPDYQFLHPLDRDGTGVNLNILRKEMAVEVIRTVQANSDKRLFYLEAPTGGGKTNISMLVVAELLDKNKELDKVFYVFPFTTLITQTHKAIKKTLGLEDDEIALMHSKAGFQSKKGKNEEEEDGFYGDEKIDFINNLFALYPLCLLTHIRFFDILKSNRKETIYLMHRLSNSIVIMDELQSYNPSEWDKMLFFIHHYAELFNIRFVLMSATLPKIDKLRIPLKNRPEFVELLPEPKRYFTNANFSERVRFNFDLLESNREISLEELAPFVYEKSKDYAQKYGNVHTIIEFIFKKAASDFQPEIELLDTAERFFDEVFVLSGTILEPRRREVINYLKNKKNRSKNILLITTQVVEAGVDIDMDLGFKNISLIDSDEQLAGRVNRNVKKEQCEVYLFKFNEPRVIYSKDIRWKVTRDNIPLEKHQEILKNKDFNQLYNEVLLNLDKRNSTDKIYTSDKAFGSYHEHIERLDFREIDKKFKLIDQKNSSVFVPLELPVEVPGPDDTNDPVELVFSNTELEFLKKAGVFQTGDKTVDGEAIWTLYRDLLWRKKEDFVRQKIDLKTMQGILSKFTFSIFDTPQMRTKFASFYDEEKSLDEYLYLSEHKKIYSYETGLIMKELENTEYQLL